MPLIAKPNEAKIIASIVKPDSSGYNVDRKNRIDRERTYRKPVKIRHCVSATVIPAKGQRRVGKGRYGIRSH